MKKLLLTALFVTLGVAAYAQGTVNFSNYGVVARRVNYSDYQSDYYIYPTLHGAAAEVGTYTVGLLFQRTGDTDFTMYGTTPLGYNNKAGYFNGGTATIPGTKSGDIVSLMLRVWPNSYSSYGEAYYSGGYVGASSPFNATLGGGSTPAAALAFTQFSLVQPCPEPTTIALGLFGCMGLLFARRHQ